MPGTPADGLTRRDLLGAAGGIISTAVFQVPASAAATAFGTAELAKLESALGRKVLTPAYGKDYDAARLIWNGLFDRRPALIASCRTAPEVALCIRFAREHALPLSVRSGGHHPAGLSMVDGGFVIDLSDMNGIQVDRESRQVTVGPGVRVFALHAATEPLGLVVPTAAHATVGVGGMVTGGGEGKLAVDATAYPHRGAPFSLLTQARWSHKTDDQANIEWVKTLWTAVLPFTTGEVYGNYISETNESMARRAYGSNYARLQNVKRRYDPDNCFNSTVGVEPA